MMHQQVIEAGHTLTSISQKINAAELLERSAGLGSFEKLAYIAYALIAIGGGVMSATSPTNTAIEIVTGAAAIAVGYSFNIPQLATGGICLTVGAVAGGLGHL